MRALAIGIAVLVIALAGVSAIPDQVGAQRGPTLGALKKRVVSQQKALRAQRVDLRIVRAQARRDRLERDAIINATWNAVGQTIPELREGSLADKVAAQIAAANAAAAAAQSQLAGSVISQIAAYPATLPFRDLISAACSRARAGGTGWSCSTYFAPGYSSYTFD